MPMPGPQGRKDQLVLVRPPPRFSWHEAFARSIDRPAAGVEHGGTCPRFLWLVARLRRSCPRPASLSAERPRWSVPRPNQRRRHAGPRPALAHASPRQRRPEARGTERTRAPTRPAGRCHAMSRTGSARRSLFVAVPDPSIHLSIYPRTRGGGGLALASPARSVPASDPMTGCACRGVR